MASSKPVLSTAVGLLREVITIKLFSEIFISWMNWFLQGIFMDKPEEFIFWFY